MTLKYVDRVLETSLTSGTGTLNLAGPVNGFRSFSVAGDGAKVGYVIDDSTGWEIGVGTVSVGSPNTLARGATPIASSNSNALVNFGSNSKNVRLAPLGALLMGRDEKLNFSDLLGAGGGTANAHTVAMPVASLGYTDGMVIMYRAPLANTTAPVTVNVDGRGARNIKINGADPAVGQIAAGALIVAVYKSSNNTFDAINLLGALAYKNQVSSGDLDSSVSFVPSGAVMPFAMSTAPTGWLVCNGSSQLRTDYPNLFAAIGTTYGSVDSTHFTLPDLRGEFIRGFDNGRGVDSGRAIGTSQAEGIIGHVHGQRTGGTASSGPQVSGGGGGAATAGFVNGGITSNTLPQTMTDAAGGAETRPRNIAMMYCIKI